jgi:hypothetical protein
MKSHSFVCLVSVLLVILFVSFAQAGERPRYSLGGDIIHGRCVDQAKAGGDTINLMAARNDPTNEPGEPRYYGDFEDADGNPAWNGWTHWDVTQPTANHWNVSNYNQPDPENHAAWCGADIPSCGGDDPDGGYGNGWDDLLEFRLAVPYPESPTSVTVTATLIHDTEPTYDYVHLSYKYQDQLIANLLSWDGEGATTVIGTVSYVPGEYLNGTDIAVYFRFTSDGAWSDQDCLFPSAGACQIDDIQVRVVNESYTEDFFENFEHGGDPENFGLWNTAFPTGVGDFAKIWEGLRDIDPCINNYSPQAAFIDDGEVVPGTGGSHCINWCYGPGGYIVTTTGGLAGPDWHIHNVIESPVMDWPESGNGSGPDDDGIIFEYGCYQHEDFSSDSPGIFHLWGVRSADTDNSGGNGYQNITEQAWQDRSFLGPWWNGYGRFRDDVTDLMNPGRDVVQVQLAVYEVGWAWYWTGNDGYPAPYFDNVTVKIFPYLGPGMSAREIDLAQDNFPRIASIDFEDLGSLSVRFDMANNISLASHLRNDPGDTIVADISPVREGAEFDGVPILHYLLDRNPVFTLEMRTAGLPDLGSVEGMPSVGLSAEVTPGKWAFDLPDTGFLFPGDVLHYYIEATDAIGGIGGTDPKTSLMPPDTTGFSTGFGDPMGYNSTFTVRALPSIRSDGLGGYEQPEILFINDFANRGGENEWYTALNNLSLLVDEDYDVYYVNGPPSGVGNGIGGRANAQLLSGYTDILYTCGNLGVNTIANGDFQNDAGDDVGVLTSWLDQGDKDILLTGDDLASDLAQAGIATLNFLENYLGVTVATSNIRPFIGNQTTPLVKVSPGNPVFLQTSSLENWYAYGACPSFNTFDGVNLLGTSQRLAEFYDPGGVGYSYSACTLNIMNPGPDQSRTISMPVDLMYVYTNPDAPSHPLPARVRLLRDVLLYFGQEGTGSPSHVTDIPGANFTTTQYPNPFNPVTTIEYSLPRAGHLKLSIYNVRGQLVKTLVDDHRPAGENQTVVWDGTDNLGDAAASGVYFYEAKTAEKVIIGKMTLLR